MEKVNNSNNNNNKTNKKAALSLCMLPVSSSFLNATAVH